MDTKYIFTADDFGPIDFVNKGICYAVSKNLVNSVQVIVNHDRPKLKNSLKELNKSVPKGNTLDIGIHLTITSGKPILKSQQWGKMLKKGSFKDFKKFYFGFDSKLKVIEDEFEAQIKRLKDILTEIENCNLKLTSLSHHHNIFTLDPKLFETYTEVGVKHGLSVRSPKSLPLKTNKTLFGFVVPFLNLSDNKEDRHKMVKMNAAIAKNKYAGSKDLTLKSPSYIDIEYYSKLGSFAILSTLKQKRINNQLEKLPKMIAKADKYKMVKDSDPKKKVVEFVFHLGDHKHKGKGFKRMTRHYAGISPKYFENRQHELFALEEFISKNEHLKQQMVTWNECGNVVFKKL